MPVPTVLSQRDPTWKDILLGNDNTSTIGRFGCLLTDLVMVSNLYGFQETPASLNEKMKAASGFLGPLIIPRLLPTALPGMRHLNFIQCRDVPAPLPEIDNALTAGRQVIVELDFSPARGLQNHWVVIYAAADGDYLIRDPYPWPLDQQEVRLTARYGFGGKLAQIIQSVLWLDGPGQPVNPVPIDDTVTASFPAYASADALALRTAPLVADDTLIERLPLNTRLDLLAADDVAKAAIGALNQWLPVRAPHGKCGHAAAWYLSLQPVAPEAVSFTPRSPAAGESFVVQPNADQVALRTKPQIGPYTLIRRLNRDEELRVLDPLEAAQAKIGQDGAWLNVADIHNQAGYIAAWLVHASGAAALGAVRKRPPSFGPEGLVVRAATDELALRSIAQITDRSLIKRLRVGANLQVLEDPDPARMKIGQVGQWLQVRDITSSEGYVAAWYVSL